MPSPTLLKTRQKNKVSPAMFSSLRHSHSAPNVMLTFANTSAAPPHQMTTITDANYNLQPNYAKNVQPELSNSGNAPQQNANANIGMDKTTSTSALFLKTVDSLHSFLSPNVVLLPVAFHSLADEQHIQLLGMPQTVIPIAIHPQMQKKFAVRPLLLDQAMAHQLLQSVPKHIGIGWPPSVDSGGGNQSPHLGNHPHFQLPVTFRPSLDHPPTIAQNAQRSPDNKQQSSVIPAAMENVSADNEHSKGEQQFSASSAVDKFEDGGDDQCKMAEPLDLSLSSARTKENENGSAMGGANCATVTGTVQRRKRTNNSSRGPPVEEMCETAAVTGRKTMRKGTTPAEAEQKRNSPSAAVGISLPPSSVSSSCCTLFPPAAIAAVPPPSVAPTVVVSRGPPSSACATVTLPVLSPVDSASRKRFLCDLCGDVSFWAMETLIGHKKYYCRNRPRPDDSSDSGSVSRVFAGPSNGGGQLSAECAPIAAAHASLGLKSRANSSSSPPSSASPPLVQCAHCPFQTATSALLSHHHKQQHSLPVVCAECGYRALTVRGLRTHARLSHSGATSAVAEQITENKKTSAANGKGTNATTKGK